MAAKASNKDSSMSAHLKATGYPHGRTKTSPKNEVPKMSDIGSAAYRRMRAKTQ
jgi:hypothetical protein